MHRLGAFLVLAVTTAAAGQQTLDTAATADAIVRSVAPTENYGAAGALSVSGSAALNINGEQMGTLDTFIRFDLTDLVQQLDLLFGSHEWTIESIELTVEEQGAPNNPIFNRGVGRFEVRWIAADAWQEGTGNPRVPTTDGVVYNDEPSLLDDQADVLVGVFANSGADGERVLALTPAGALVDDIKAGGAVSLFLTAVDETVGFTFLARDNSGGAYAPRLAVTASPPPTGPFPPGAEPLGSVTETSIEAHWNSGGNPEGTEYLAECFLGPDFSGQKVAESGWSESFSHEFTGLGVNTRHSVRVRARQGAELSEWTELTSGGVYTLAVEPGVLTVGLQVLDGDRLNLNGPASHSLGLVELGLGGNPSGTEMAVKLGQGSNTWLRLVDVGGRVDVFADASGPDWRPATDWAGKRLRGLAAGFELHVYAQARNGDGEPTALREVAIVTTNAEGDVNRTGIASALDYALVKAHILRGGAIGSTQAWACDADDSGALDDTDLSVVKDEVMNP